MQLRNLLISAMMIIACTFAVARADVIPTMAWTPFVGTTCTLNGQPLTIGSVVQAFTPADVLCGEFIVHQSGAYGSMAVYGDDPYTPSVVEGCVAGEHITFRINGRIATELNPDDVWVSPSVTKLMNLASIQTFTIALSGPAEGLGKAGTQVKYTVTITNNGDGTDKIGMTGVSAHGWTLTGLPVAASYYTAGQAKSFDVFVSIPAGTTPGIKDDLDLTATSTIDPGVPAAQATKKNVTTVDTETGVDDTPYSVPGLFTLNQNYPNPFNPETVISFSLEKTGHVNLIVYDILGRTVQTLESANLAAGEHTYRWLGADDAGRPVASGVYFYRLSTNGMSLTRKMALMR